uniref:Glycoside hydrolase family 18 protein n=1 Tax=Mycena chlorophos TaxID=658473 RepID=A0ABQ0LUT1_MYCCL|nr:glycoside hydrolase family 18 protein [Mycena chlorophos]
MHRHSIVLVLSLALLLVAHAGQYCGLRPPSGALSSSSGSSSGSGGITTTGNSSADTSDVVASAWYPGWEAQDFPPSMISWSKYNSMIFAFATTTTDTSTIALDDISAQALPDFVTLAKSNGVSALLSIGGWTGSMYYSSAVATAENRTTFVNAVLDLVSKYNLDGIDFDWEYPARQGLGCNVVSSEDSANFLSFLQQLRGTSAGKNLILTAPVSLTPFIGSDGEPMSDVSAFADVLNYIEIMNYDVWGSWSSTVGPNAPLADACAAPANQQGSATSAVSAWSAAKFPANQIVLGLASYGHSFSVSPGAALRSNGSLALYPTFDASNQPLGSADSPGDATALDPCGNPEGISGIFTFAGLVQEGYLTENGTAANGIDYVYDYCSQTPFVYNETSMVMISYDDATSFAAKGRFINAQNLAGYAVWDVTGDFDDILLDSLHDAMGIVSVCE